MTRSSVSCPFCVFRRTSSGTAAFPVSTPAKKAVQVAGPDARAACCAIPPTASRPAAAAAIQKGRILIAGLRDEAFGVWGGTRADASLRPAPLDDGVVLR